MHNKSKITFPVMTISCISYATYLFFLLAMELDCLNTLEILCHKDMLGVYGNTVSKIQSCIHLKYSDSIS